MLATPSWAQKTTAKSTPSPAAASAPPASGGGGGGGQSPASSDKPGDLGYAIESEMLTYQSLESNSQAVACDVGAYLAGGSGAIVRRKTGTVCEVKGGNRPKASVVILPFTGSTLDDFQLWRTDMEIMKQLRTEAATYCPESEVAAIGARGLADLTPAGSAVSALQTAIGLFASQTSTTPVTGTIHDDAFMTGVARELHNLNISVLIPSIYSPSSMTALDPAASPFLASLEKVQHARICLAGTLDKLNGANVSAGEKATIAQEKPEIDQIVANIDSYLAPFKVASGGSPAPNSKTAGEGAAGSDAIPAPFPSPAGMASILTADNLAQKLGIDASTGLPGSVGARRYFLLLKMLESGGTVNKVTSIFGSKVRYGGGSVGTFALFAADGELECSGNVYAYGGSVPPRHFEAEMRRNASDPGEQFIIRSGGCHSPGQ
ncbi:MAG TPA: hypothetical protein VHW09_12975 [Bryobacteraceae bacterium]|jgi:hypothetical protein|nr:hypothetical protein [Bryobacteraceae bacterium]